MATAKKNVPVEDEMMEEDVKPVTKRVNKPKHDPNELVMCRSVRFGELRLIGPKTRMPYSWANEGDFREVEYQDLVSWRALHSRYLFDPMIIIEDEDISFETHRMSLKTEPFSQIRSGEKYVEMRLFDEKRKKIRVGDRIVFTHTENEEETIRTRVVGLHKYGSFDEMLLDFPASALGVADRNKNLDKIMSSYYAEEDIQRYGTLAIRLMLE